jgi:dihydropyrimidinase
MRTLIAGGTVADGSVEQRADVLVDGEHVVAVGRGLDSAAERVIDADGAYVLPGLVDPHTHFDSPYEGVNTRDDLESGSIAAAFGGTTTVIDFALQLPGQRILEAFRDWRARVELTGSVIDYGFHITLTDLEVDGAESDLEQLVGEGVTSFKFYMAPDGPIRADDQTLFRGLQLAAELGAMALVHAENADVIAVLQRQALEAGHITPIWHAHTRPALTEGEAAGRAIQLAQFAGAPVYIVHISCEEAASEVARARERGWRVWGETCTQYLYIEESALDRPGFEGAKYVFTPPPRSRTQIDSLWSALERGSLSVVSTDHCPYDWRGQKSLGESDFTKIPGGAPGVEERLTMVYRGVSEGRMSMNVMIDALAGNPARIFGLYPRKGAIVPGSDADIVVFDPAVRTPLSAATQHSRVDYNLFEGETGFGAPRTVLVRGRPVIEDGELVAEPGHGRFVARDRVS